MRKRAAVMDALRKHRLIIFICAGVLFAAVFALLFVNGIITKDISGVPERITYGEELTFEGGDAVFGSTYCEYSVAGADEWSETQPVMPGDYVVLLDEHGKEYTSMQFASYMEKKMQTVTKRLVFIIGGPYGFSETIYKTASEKISLSKMTFSHQMIRVIFIEQLYRAMTILNNEPYHHE